MIKMDQTTFDSSEIICIETSKFNLLFPDGFPMSILEDLCSHSDEDVIGFVKEISDESLEILHTLSHAYFKELGDIACRSHFYVANEMLDRGLKHINRTICDQVVELIRNYKTYDPSKVPDKVLLDDNRIVHAWISRLEKGLRFNSDQFKDLSLEEQKKVIYKLKEEIEKEMIKRGFKISEKDSDKDKIDLSPKSIFEEINPSEIDPSYVIDLSDDELIALYRKIHDMAKEHISEDLMNANIFIGIELFKRGLYDDYKIDDKLTEITEVNISEYPTIKGFSKDTITLEDVIEAFQETPNIPVEGQPYSCYLAGRIVNEGSIPSDHDIDLIFRQRPDPRLIASIKRILPNWLSERLHIVFDPNGPEVGYSIPLYNYGFFLVPENEMKKGFGPFRYESLSKLKPGMIFRLLKQKTGWNKNEFWQYEDLWNNWASKYIQNKIHCSKKYDGRSFLIWILKNGDVKIITEDEMRDRSDQLPNVIEEFSKIFKDHDVSIHAECVAYSTEGKIIKSADVKENSCEEIPREDTAFLTIGKITEEQENSLVFHAHDLIYYDEDLSEKPYCERFEILENIVPDNCRFINVVKFEIAKNPREFKEAVDKLRSLKGSEGVFFRSCNATYPIKTSGENRSPLLAKIKNLKSVDVMVWDRIAKEEKETHKRLPEYMYDCVFLIPKELKDKFDKVFEYNGNYYSYIGRTYATSDKRERGDIIEVLVGRIREYINKRTGKTYISWMFPKYKEFRSDKKEPDNLNTIRKLSKVGPGILNLDNKIVKLKLCPYFEDFDICLLKRIFGRTRDEELTKFEYLKFPIICPIASFYRCRYLKSYYYGIKDFDIGDIIVEEDDDQ